MSTKEKLLDTAERLISQQGFAATSLRQIIAQAGVNLAAVHYHFGSKQELLDEVIARKAVGVNEERHALLERYEKEAGGTGVSVERILAAFFEPVIAAGAKDPQFVKLMGRLFAEGLISLVVERHFQPTLMRFVGALQKAAPHLSQAELYWRLQFMIGAMSQAIIGVDPLPAGIAGKDAPRDFGCVIRRLIVFLDAGFRAPATAGNTVHGGREL